MNTDLRKLRTDMAKLSDLKTAAEVRAGDMQDLAYRREYERTRLANDVAIKVLQYRRTHGLSQTGLAALLDMRQPNIARLEAGEHVPNIETLSRLADVLKLDFSVEVKPGRLRLRRPVPTGGAQATVTSISGRAKPKKPTSVRGRRRLDAVAASADGSDRGSRKALNSSTPKAGTKPRGKAN